MTVIAFGERNNTHKKRKLRKRSSKQWLAQRPGYDGIVVRSNQHLRAARDSLIYEWTNESTDPRSTRASSSFIAGTLKRLKRNMSETILWGKGSPFLRPRRRLGRIV